MIALRCMASLTLNGNWWSTLRWNICCSRSLWLIKAASLRFDWCLWPLMKNLCLVRWILICVVMFKVITCAWSWNKKWVCMSVRIHILLMMVTLGSSCQAVHQKVVCCRRVVSTSDCSLFILIWCVCTFFDYSHVCLLSSPLRITNLLSFLLNKGDLVVNLIVAKHYKVLIVFTAGSRPDYYWAESSGHVRSGTGYLMTPTHFIIMILTFSSYWKRLWMKPPHYSWAEEYRLSFFHATHLYCDVSQLRIQSFGDQGHRPGLPERQRSLICCDVVTVHPGWIIHSPKHWCYRCCCHLAFTATASSRAFAAIVNWNSFRFHLEP